MPEFCVDIDNTIARTDEVMRRVIGDFTGGRVQLDRTDIKTFNYYECSDARGNSITKDDWKQIHDLFSEPRYLWLVEPIPGAVEGLRRLAEVATIHLATSRLRKARRTTVEWLDAHDFPIHDLHFLRHGEKHSSLKPFTAAVEDDYDQAVSFVKGGTPCYLISHPWNDSRPDMDGVSWADSWEELTESLLALIRPA